MMKQRKKQLICQSILISMQTIIVYLLIIIPTEYLLTEQWLILKKINPVQKKAFLIIVFTLVSSLNQAFNISKKLSIHLKKNLSLLFILFVLLITGNYFYSKYYHFLQQYPKIYSVKPNWSIQGSLVKIDGKNFGYTHESGKVKVGQLEYQIKKWDNTKIIAEQPAPRKFFKGKLKVIRANNKESNLVEFEIKNPSEI